MLRYILIINILILIFMTNLECKISKDSNTSFISSGKINPILGAQYQHNSKWAIFYPQINESIESKLKFILDRNSLFDQWISNTKPNKIYIQFNGTKQIESYYNFLVKLKNFTFLDLNGKALSVSKDIVSSMQRWLVQETGCPMDYIWSKLADDYWPRWIKKGLCVSTNSCSWPPGMTCKGKRNRKLPLLRWKCEEDHDQKKYLAAAKDVERDNQKRRKKRQNETQYRNQIFRKKMRSRRRLFSAKQKQKKIRKFFFLLSKQSNGYFCKWEKDEYHVVDYCTCSC